VEEETKLEGVGDFALCEGKLRGKEPWRLPSGKGEVRGWRGEV